MYIIVGVVLICQFILYNAHPFKLLLLLHTRQYPLMDHVITSVVSSQSSLHPQAMSDHCNNNIYYIHHLL